MLQASCSGESGLNGATSKRLANVSAAATWYPMVQSGLFLKGGAGYSRLSADDGIVSASDGGFGVLAGMGYDVRIARTTSITPVLNYFRGAFDGGSADVVQVGMGITFH